MQWSYKRTARFWSVFFLLSCRTGRPPRGGCSWAALMLLLPSLHKPTLRTNQAVCGSCPKFSRLLFTLLQSPAETPAGTPTFSKMSANIPAGGKQAASCLFSFELLLPLRPWPLPLLDGFQASAGFSFQSPLLQSSPVYSMLGIRPGNGGSLLSTG